MCEVKRAVARFSAVPAWPATYDRGIRAGAFCVKTPVSPVQCPHAAVSQSSMSSSPGTRVFVPQESDEAIDKEA
jgi:hypothetical protein